MSLPSEEGAATQLPSRGTKSPPRPYSKEGWSDCLEQLVHLFVHYRSKTMKFEQLMDSLCYCNGQPVFPSSNKPFRRYANSRVQQHKIHPNICIVPIDKHIFKSFFFDPNTFIDELFVNKEYQDDIKMGTSKKGSRSRSHNRITSDLTSIEAPFDNDEADAYGNYGDSFEEEPQPLVNRPPIKQLVESAQVNENPVGLMVVVGAGQANDLGDANLKWITVTYHAWSPSDAEKVEMELYAPNKDGETSTLRFTYPAVSDATVNDFKKIAVINEVYHKKANSLNKKYVSNIETRIKETEDKISFATSLGLNTMLLRLPKPYKCHNQQWQGQTHNDSNIGEHYLKKTKSACPYDTAVELENWGVGIKNVCTQEHRYYVTWMIPLAGGEGLKVKEKVRATAMTEEDFANELHNVMTGVRGMGVV